jgi:hypothetical protein
MSISESSVSKSTVEVASSSYLSGYGWFTAFIRGNYREALIALLVTWLLVSSAVRATYETNVLMDFRCFYDAAIRLATGRPLYEPGTGFMYLPLIPLLLKPTLALGFDSILKFWLGANLIAYIGASVLMSFLAVGREKIRWSIYCGILLICMHNWAFSMELLGANCDMILALIFSGMVYAVRIQKFRLFSCLVVVGTLFKFWMFGLIGYLILKRQFKESVICIALTAIATASMFQIVGWNQVSSLTDTTRLYSERKITTNIVMQSISGFSDVHFKNNTFVLPLIDNDKVRLGFTLTAGATVLLTLLISFLRRTPNSPEKETIHLCLFLISMFIVMPICHVSYAVIVLPAISLIIFGNGRFQPATKLSLILLYFVLTRIQVVEHIGLSKGINNSIAGLLISAPFLWYVALWMVLVSAIFIGDFVSRSSKLLAKT